MWDKTTNMQVPIMNKFPHKAASMHISEKSFNPPALKAEEQLSHRSAVNMYLFTRT